MKKLLLIICIIFFLNSCDTDIFFEKEGDLDKDDINIIDKIGDQSIDKAIKLYDTNTSAS